MAIKKYRPYRSARDAIQLGVRIKKDFVVMLDRLCHINGMSRPEVLERLIARAGLEWVKDNRTRIDTPRLNTEDTTNDEAQ